MKEKMNYDQNCDRAPLNNSAIVQCHTYEKGEVPGTSVNLEINSACICLL